MGRILSTPCMLGTPYIYGLSILTPFCLRFEPRVFGLGLRVLFPPRRRGDLHIKSDLVGLVAQGRLLEINMNTGGFLSPPSRRGRCAVQEKWNATLDTAQRGGQTLVSTGV
jgi:hypothetical protein